MLINYELWHGTLCLVNQMFRAIERINAMIIIMNHVFRISECKRGV